MRKVLILLLAATALGACHQGGSVAAPPRKAGLWQLTTLNDGQPAPGVFAQPVKLCVDASVDRKMGVLGRKRGNCDKYDVVKGADGSYTVDAVCKTGTGMSITNHTVVTGDFTTKYSSVSDTTVSGSDNPDFNGKHERKTTATYVGDCPAGMSPGQIQTSDGQITDMPSGRGGGAGGGRGGG